MYRHEDNRPRGLQCALNIRGIRHCSSFQRGCEEDWLVHTCHVVKRLVPQLVGSSFATSFALAFSGRRMRSQVRRTPGRNAFVGQCTMVATAPLTPVAPAVGAWVGTLVLMPVPGVAHLLSISVVQEMAVRSASPGRCRVRFFSDQESDLPCGRYHCSYHLAQACPLPVSGARRCCHGRMATVGAACPHERTTKTRRTSRGRSMQLQLAAQSRLGSQLPGPVIYL